MNVYYKYMDIYSDYILLGGSLDRYNVITIIYFVILVALGISAIVLRITSSDSNDENKKRIAANVMFIFQIWISLHTIVSFGIKIGKTNFFSKVTDTGETIGTKLENVGTKIAKTASSVGTKIKDSSVKLGSKIKETTSSLSESLKKKF